MVPLIIDYLIVCGIIFIIIIEYKMILSNNNKAQFYQPPRASPAEDILSQIEQRYLEGDFDECLHLIDRRFIGLRSHF